MDQNSIAKQILDVKSISQRLGVSMQHVRELIRNGALAGTKIGSQWVCETSSFQSFLKANSRTLNPKDHSICCEVPKPVCLSFFSGAMGLDIGLENEGFKAALACEFNKACRMTINANRGMIGLIGDINNYEPADILKMAGLPPHSHIDVVFGGPPCQAFSTAGARRGFDDERGNVFLTYLSRIASLQPNYVVIENVRGLLSVAYPYGGVAEPIKGGALKLILDRLRQYGYAVSFNLYNAAYFGAPQIRERIVIIAKRGSEKVPYLIPTHSDRPEDGLPPFITFREAVAGIENLPQHYIEFPERRLKYYRMLSEGQYWKDLPPSIQKEAMGKSFELGGGKTGFYRRLSYDRPSPTLVTNPTMPATDLCHPTLDRPLSIEEYKAIQGFPSDWIICGSILDQYKQLGNAVPVKLGEAIGRMLADDMRGCPKRPSANFKYSRYVKTNEIEWESDFEERYHQAAESIS